MNEMYMHTPKAVRHNSGLIVAPPDRVFLVVNSLRGQHVAWKCELTRSGLRHPGFASVLKFDELERGFILKARNGAEPTAIFKHDSFYKKVTLAHLRAAAVSLPTVPMGVSNKRLLSLSGGVWLKIQHPLSKVYAPVLLLGAPSHIPASGVSLDCFDPSSKCRVHVRGHQVVDILGDVVTPTI